MKTGLGISVFGFLFLDKFNALDYRKTMDIRTHRFVHVFLIFAFIMAQVSPACAFVSGKMGLLEICGADGTVQVIEVPAAYDLTGLMEQQNSTQAPEHQKASKQCAFCFAQNYLIKHFQPAIEVAMPLIEAGILVIGAGSVIYKSYFSNGFQARGPPFFFA